MRVLLVALPIVMILLGPATASGDVRSVVLSDGADPNIAFDVKQVQVSINRDSGDMHAIVAFHQPVPDPALAQPGWGFVLWVDQASYACEGSGDGDSAGDVYARVGRGSQSGLYELTFQVKFRREYTTLPVSINPGRTQIEFAIKDDLLRGSDPRCLNGWGEGRLAYDPALSNGGPTTDDLDGHWFDGQDPDDPRNQTFELRYSARNPQRLQPRSRGRYVNLMHETRCSLACRLSVSGYATTPVRRKIAGLTLLGEATFEAAEVGSIGYEFTPPERRRLARAFARYGRVRYVLRLAATDPIGRVKRMTRVITLLPPSKRKRAATNGPSAPSGGGDRDCSDFTTQREAQRYFESRGGSPSNNVDRLDADRDGDACEVLP